MNASFSWHDNNPSHNKLQSKMAKQPLNKRQFCFSCATPFGRTLHPYALLIADSEGGPRLILPQWNLPVMSNSTDLCSKSGWQAFHECLVFHLTKGLQMPNTCSKMPLLPSSKIQMEKSPCGNNILCNICCLGGHTAGNSFLVLCS